MIDTTLLLAGKAASAGIYSISYFVIIQRKYAFRNSPGDEDLPRREVGLKLKPFTGRTGRDKQIKDILAGATMAAPVEPFLHFVKTHNFLLRLL